MESKLSWDDLTPECKAALRRPCYFAVETSNPRYARMQGLGSLIVTVNTGYE